jgi:hypothetical protein
LCDIDDYSAHKGADHGRQDSHPEGSQASLGARHEDRALRRGRQAHRRLHRDGGSAPRRPVGWRQDGASQLPCAQGSDRGRQARKWRDRTNRALRNYYNTLIATFPPSRLLTPDPRIWAEAGLIAGTLSRTQNFQRHQRKECLNDALIFLTAAKAGVPVLTASRKEFDLIHQLAPHGRFVHF